MLLAWREQDDGERGGEDRNEKGETCVPGEVVLSFVKAVTGIGKGCVVFGCVCRQQLKACGSALAVSFQNKHGWKYTAVVLLAFVTLVTPLFAQRSHVRWSAVASYAASEFDAGTTYAAMQGCQCREGNPLLRPFASNPSIFFVLGGQAWATNSAAEDLEQSGHGRWARVLTWGIVAVHVAAGANNLRVMDR